LPEAEEPHKDALVPRYGVKLLFDESSKDQLFLVLPPHELPASLLNEVSKDLFDEICTCIIYTTQETRSDALPVQDVTLTG